MAHPPSGVRLQAPRKRGAFLFDLDLNPIGKYDLSRVPAYFRSTLKDFLTTDPDAVLGALVQGNTAEAFRYIETTAADVWAREIPTLKDVVSKLLSSNSFCGDWHLLLEFPVPRRMKRIDAVLLAQDVVFVLEFKTGVADSSAYWQVWDYALDLVDFHKPSHSLKVIPLVVADDTHVWNAPIPRDGRVNRPQFSKFSELAAGLNELFAKNHQPAAKAIDAAEWDRGQYRAVPTIVEGALAVFRGMEVREIAQSHAEAENLTTTVDAIISIVRRAREESRKVICFVTGVPGAGKTLAGLRAVHDSRISDVTGSDPHFMSGNGPLVKVLREALLRDRVTQTGTKRKHIERKVGALIQNVHVMAREHWSDNRPPEDRVIVFDEAQRAWNAKQNFRKFKRNVSEPEMLLSILDRHDDWAAIVALVGGGQEINDGEAGLREWGRAVESKFSHWHVVAAPEAIHGGASVAGSTLFEERQFPNGVSGSERQELHLAVSTRSIKAQKLAEWVNLLLKGDISPASELAKHSTMAYVSRDLNCVKRYLLESTEGTARCGLLASSAASRLRAFGIETSTSFHRSYGYTHWFLNGREDVRSSFQLEVAATEFEVQGLELDIACLCWGLDLPFKNGHWKPRRLGATIWSPKKPTTSKWLSEKGDPATFRLNAYRVLLTRARQRLVIWVPRGDENDATNSPTEYDHIFDALIEAGAHRLDEC